MTSFSQTKAFDAAEHARAILQGERLLPLQALVVRWGVSSRQVREWANGHHPAGLELRAFRPSRKVLRFRVADVVAFEQAAGLGQ